MAEMGQETLKYFCVFGGRDKTGILPAEPTPLFIAISMRKP